MQINYLEISNNFSLVIAASCKLCALQLRRLRPSIWTRRMATPADGV